MKKYSVIQARTLISLALGTLMLFAALPAFAGPPTEYIKARSDILFQVINQPIGAKRTSALKKEVRSLVAYDELAKRALGKHWEARTDTEKKEFIDLLEKLVELNYADRFKERAGDLRYIVKYTGEKVRKSTGQSIVKTEIEYGDDTILLDYKLLVAGKSFVTYDVVFDDISLEETYRESYVPIIAKEGWTSLIKRMNDKLTELQKAK